MDRHRPDQLATAGPAAPSAAANLLHGRFLASAARYPDAMALRIGPRTWTYAEVAETARRWAAALTDTLGAAPQRVGVFAYRSEVSYVGVLASLFAGAAFVPLNRTFPTDRTRLMIEQADLDALIVDRASLPQLGEICRGLRRAPACVLLPDAEPGDAPELDTPLRGQADLARARPPGALPAVAADQVAYLLFTSGSTGQPKGVPISHANAAHFLEVNQQRYQLTPDDRLTQTFDQTFDLSVFDLFMAWSSGAGLCAMQPIQMLSPFRFLQEQGVTVWFSVPSAGALLRKQNLLRPGSMPGLRWSLFCGEGLPRSTAEAWQAAAPNSVVENLYGPTELTIACTVYRWDPQRSPAACVNELVPIGQPYPGLDALIVDEDLQPVAPGGEGELCVAGPQTFQGYWRDAAQTAQRMLSAAGPSGAQQRYYRTGDRVRQLPDGTMVHLGRMDQQIKVQGYRVELSEIEGVLTQQPGVIAAVALGWPVENGSASGVVAFVAGPAPAPAALLEAARQRLPAYMAPRAIFPLEAMPLNSNGKIDRKELQRRLAAGEVPQ